MRILIAPNAFKGSLDAHEAADAILSGLEESRLDFDVITLPIADGGDGSLGIIAHHLKARLIRSRVHSASGKETEANWAWNEKEALAVIELAEASGLRKINAEDMNPWTSHTYGTGELIRQALDKGCKNIVLGIGGSATIDGGLGILKALGVTFQSEDGSPFNPSGPCDFHKIGSIDATGAREKLEKVQFSILSDVKNTILGSEGAVPVFGPQKGLEEDELDLFVKSMEHWVALLEKNSGKELRSLPGGGASGGVPVGLSAFFKVNIKSGADAILEMGNFDHHAKHAHLVITAEGQIDQQTAFGKGPAVIAGKAKKYQLPVIGLFGQISDDYDPRYSVFDAVFPINSKLYDLPTAIARTRVNLKFTATQIGNLLAARELFQ
jgi:glycerate kinase